MPSELQPDEHLDALAAEHRSWLSRFDPRYLQEFEDLFHANYESAMTEAAVRRVLQGHDMTVEPSEDLTDATRKPDFCCARSSCEYRFYVEVTCISIQKVVEETGLPYPNEKGYRDYRPLNDAFWSACKHKAAQCGGLEHPAIVAIGTFHYEASAICLSKPHVEMLLTGETSP